MGREEEREILAGNRPEHDPQLHATEADIPEPDRRGAGEQDTFASAYAAGDPDAVPADVTDRREYQEALAEARRQVKAEEAVLEDGRRDMPPTRYE